MGSMAGSREIRPDCPNAANPFHQCGDHCGGGKTSPAPKLSTEGRVRTATSPAQNGERAEAGRNVDPNCVNASNPFHRCADYCTKRTADAKKLNETGKSGRFFIPKLKLSPKSSGKGSEGSISVRSEEGFSLEGRNVDPSCVNASNPFHQCAEYCTRKTADARKQSDRVKTGILHTHVVKNSPRSPSSEGSSSVQNGESSKEEVRKMVVERKVDPACVNASNPFHQCAEYCSQRRADAKRRTNEQTLGALLARESEEVAIKENKEERVIREIRKIDPRCPNASNPFLRMC